MYIHTLQFILIGKSKFYLSKIRKFRLILYLILKKRFNLIFPAKDASFQKAAPFCYIKKVKGRVENNLRVYHQLNRHHSWKSSFPNRAEKDVQCVSTCASLAPLGLCIIVAFSSFILWRIKSIFICMRAGSNLKVSLYSSPIRERVWGGEVSTLTHKHTNSGQIKKSFTISQRKTLPHCLRYW